MTSFVRLDGSGVEVSGSEWGWGGHLKLQSWSQEQQAQTGPKTVRANGYSGSSCRLETGEMSPHLKTADFQLTLRCKAKSVLLFKARFFRETELLGWMDG
jgi:hypothetical protein